MTLKQRLLKLAYPVVMWFANKSGKEKLVLSNHDTAPATSIYSLTGELSSGQPLGFDKLKGKKILLVNTASDCGLTAQYEELEKLHQQFRDRLTIIGFPSNDFKDQEKGIDADIEKFCKINYGVSFPLMKKTAVKKSSDQNKIYQWLSNASQNGWNEKAPEWNFSKYLVDENGKLLNYFAPTVSPLDAAVTRAILK